MTTFSTYTRSVQSTTGSGRASEPGTPRIGSPEATDSAPAGARDALDRAVEHLWGRQMSDGWWKGELATNVTMDAEDLMLRQFLGIRTPEQSEEAARWIRSQQLADGSWNLYHGGPGDPSTTIEAYVALRLAGDQPDDPQLALARSFVLDRGGIESSRVFTRIWLAMFGEWPWDDVPAIPPEAILLPRQAPVNIYDFGCWARQTIVPLAIVRALRPVGSLGFSVRELSLGTHAPGGGARRGGWLSVMDRALRRYEDRPIRSLRKHSLHRCAEWIIARQEADGSWGGIQPPWVYSLLALRLLGYPLDHPVLRAGLQGLDRFTVSRRTPSGNIRWLEACQSPVWDTALALIALSDAGVDPHDPRLARAATWMAGQEIQVTGDWAVQRPDLAPGGWAFEFDNDGYPDTDDTAEVVMALRRVRLPGDRQHQLDAPADRGVAWLAGMQSRDGGWGAFDADNTNEILPRLPFCDFGAVTDPPSADVTAHIVEALAKEGLAGSDVVQRGVQWLLQHQEPDGSWFGRWGANHVYGTGAAVPALVSCGLAPTDPAIRRAVAWLESVQNEDGGWGEDLRSYEDPAWIGRGASTPSQTAWALLALHSAGQGKGPAARRGVGWLVATQRADGGWDEAYYTGTGFPGDFYINYHLYRLVFPISALGRILRGDS